MNNSSSNSYFIISFIVINLIFFMSACTNSNNPLSPEKLTPDPFEQNIKLGRGVNLGNALEAPIEGDWGVVLKEEYFNIISSAGFNSVRVPIRWSAHALTNAPYQIDETFFKRIDWVIKKSLENNLAVIINFHHYEEMMDNPLVEKERFIELWKQISERYKNYSDDLFFEILNEPHNNLNSDIWNTILAEAINTIRIDNPYRTILVGTADWGGISSLQNLRLPENEKNIIVTFHYYNPFRFTHQGAEWVDGSENWLGTKWSDSSSEQIAIKGDFNLAIGWASFNNVPLNLGEFGAYHKADINSRVLWTRFVAGQAVENNISFHYWEFGAGFGIYDRTSESWNEQLLSALIPSL